MASLKKFRIASVGLLSLLLSCNLINPKEDIPIYLTIDSFALSVAALQGSDSKKISDAWVFVNDDLLGSFELPARIPLLAEGTKTIGVFAGIKDNGNSATRIIYPFYGGYEQDINLQQGTEITIDPSITYGSNADFAFIEDFEFGTVFTAGSNCFTLDAAAAFESNRGGLLKMDPSTTCEIITADNFALPGGGAFVYLEMDYNSQLPLDVGITGFAGVNSVSVYTHHINPSEGWNKIYLNLTDQISSWAGSLGTTKYQIKIRAVNSSDDLFTEVYLDNLKLLH